MTKTPPSGDDERPQRTRRNTTLSRLLRAPFKGNDKGPSSPIRATLGPLLKLDNAVQFLDKDQHRYDVTATNDEGALIVGRATGLKNGDKLRLGRRMNAGVVFFLATITRIEQRSSHPLRRIWIQWDAFTGTSEALVTQFLETRMRVNILDRFQVGAATTKDSQPMFVGNQPPATTDASANGSQRMGPLGVVPRQKPSRPSKPRLVTSRSSPAVPRFQAGTDGAAKEG